MQLSDWPELNRTIGCYIITLNIYILLNSILYNSLYQLFNYDFIFISVNMKLGSTMEQEIYDIAIFLKELLL